LITPACDSVLAVVGREVAPLTPLAAPVRSLITPLTDTVGTIAGNGATRCGGSQRARNS
jgi:hypothetical protein